MPNHIPLSRTLTSNTAKKCSVNHCQRPRFKLCSACRRHSERARRWGHPVHGRAWQSQNIKPYHPVAEAFIEAHREHAGIVRALAWLQAQLDRCAVITTRTYFPSLGERALRHLAQRGVEAEEVLVRAFATTLYMVSLPDYEADLTVFCTNLAHHTLRAAPGFHRGRNQTRYSQALGRTLFAGLRSLLVGLIQHKREIEREEAEHEAAMKTPFTNK
jgi:hypothetical protein